MKILPKYLILFLVGTMFTVGVAFTSLLGLKGLLGTTDQLFDRDLVINSLANQFGIKLARLRQVEKEFFVFPDNPSRQGKYIIVWNNLYSEIAEDIIPGLDEPLRGNNDTRKLAMVALVTELLAENSLEWQRVARKFGETKSFEAVNMAEYGVFKKRMKELEDIAVRLTESSLADLQGRRDDLEATRGRIALIIKIMLALSILWGVGASLFVARRMLEAIGDITVLADQLSCGRITGDLQVERSDELGDLATAVVRIQKSMRILLARLKQSE
ncbi:MAG: methyl-accepting chemotaxis protein [Thermodesulfobacteriota bacterium]